MIKGRERAMRMTAWSGSLKVREERLKKWDAAAFFESERLKRKLGLQPIQISDGPPKCGVCSVLFVVCMGGDLGIKI